MHFSTLQFAALTLIIFFTNLFIPASAQAPAGNRIIGKVTDATTNQPLPFATVAVLQRVAGKDSLLGGATTTDSGDFTVANLPAGSLLVKVSFVGYQAIEKTARVLGVADLGALQLTPDASLLKEVSVKAQKSQVDLSLEKRVFSVSKNLTTVGGTAENLLRNVPSIALAADGTATLRNAPTTIYINGKPTQLTLAQIPANQIESVEVISNPSARYDASTSGGIVNLVLRKNRQPGYTGTASVGIGNNSRYDGTVNLDINRGKWNVTVGYNLNATKNPLNNYTHRTSFNTNGTVQGYYDQTTAVNLNNLFQNGRVAADYALNKNNDLSLAATYVAGKFNSFTDQQYTNRDAQQALTSYGTRTTKPDNTYNNTGLEFDWKHRFAQKGRTLSLTTGYNHNWISNAADWYTTALNAATGTTPATSQTGYPERDIITGRTVGDQVVAQLDYTHPINDSTKWEIGLRTFSYGRDQQYFFNQLVEPTQSYTLLPDYSQNARITETVNALYALYTHKLRHNFSLQAGLRVEQSSLKGRSRFEPETTFGYEYPSAKGGNFIKAFFPSFALTKKLSEESEIGVNLSRKIGRPGWRQVFVGIQSNDRQNITIGNPALQPEFVNTAELNYSKSWGDTRWLSTLYYVYEDNTIKPFVSPSASDPSVFVTTFTNVKADVRAGLDQTLTFVVAKNLSIMANLNAFNVSLQTDTYTRTLWAYNAKLNFTYRFPANWSVQVNTNNDSRFPQLQGYRNAVRAADFALRKSFMNNTASLTFTINDVFNSRRPVTVYDQPTAYQESMTRREVRFYKVTLQLPLGRSDAQSRRKKEQKMGRPDVDFNN